MSIYGLSVNFAQYAWAGGQLLEPDGHVWISCGASLFKNLHPGLWYMAFTTSLDDAPWRQAI